MMARLQKIVIFVLLAIASGCAGILGTQGNLGWVLAIFALLFCGHAVVLAFEFMLVAVVNRSDPAPAARAGELFRAWWGEVVTDPQVFCWQQPFRSRTQPDHLPPASNRVGVVFVHGFVCNRGLWNPWLIRLRRLGVPFVAVNLEPVFGSIDDYTPIIEQAVHDIETATRNPPLIVAHSMGGLAVRAWLADHHADARVCHVVTIGTPHRGTLLAKLALSLNARQMRPNSEWQRALVRREPTSRHARFTCFYSNCDNIILPASSATLEGAENRHLAGVAHVHFARQEVVFREVLQRVGLATATRPPGEAL